MFLKEKKNYIVIVLCVLLILAFGYIVMDKYNEGQREKLDAVYQQGVNAGAERAGQLLMNQIMSDLNAQGMTAITVPTPDGGAVTIPLIAQTTIIQSLNENGFFAFNTVNQNNETVQVQLIQPETCSQVQQG